MRSLILIILIAILSSSQAFSMTKPTTPPFRLGYVTDVEGDYDYFLEYVRRSNVLDFDDDDSQLMLRDEDYYFVYGGDAVDKGPGDIRLCRALVALKKAYPDRVHLLVGNRDLNKLRFSAELSDEDMARDMDEIPKPHWDPSAPTLREFLQGVVATSKKAESTDDDYDIEQINTRVNRLKYMLIHTLGCPETFEHRRKELSILQKRDESSVTDEDVVASFQKEMEPGGSLREYLEHACVVALVGNTLFAHGAVDADTIKFVPSLHSKFKNPTSCPEPGAIKENLHEWVEALNDFLRVGLDDYAARPFWNEERSSRGGETLMALQNRPAMWGRSIISNCYGDGGCIHTPQAAEQRAKALEQNVGPLKFEGLSSDPADPVVAEWLLRHGVQRVVVGHKPTGDCPAVLSSSYTGVEIVSADTSYSSRSEERGGRFGRFRGDAIPVVEIVGPSATCNQLEASGILACGKSHLSRFPLLTLNDGNGKNRQHGINGDANLGKRLPDGWWVKAAIPPHYHLCQGSGRQVQYERVSMAKVAAALEGAGITV